MSSVKVVGIVLAVIPLLISAVEASRNGYDKSLLAFRKRKYVDKLAVSLLFQKQIVSETGDSNDIIATIKANLAARKYQIDFIARLTLSFRGSTMNKSVKALDNATNALHKFYQVALINRGGLPSAGSFSSHRSSKMVKALRRINSSANHLYMAFCQCCRSDTCQHEHEVDVFLEERINIADASKSLKSAGRSGYEAASFNLMFSAVHVNSSQTWWRELFIHISEQVEHDNLSSSIPSRVRFQKENSPQIETVISKPCESIGSDTVHDFCSALTAASHGAHRVTFVLHDNQRISTRQSEQHTILNRQNVQKVTLKSLLLEREGKGPSVGIALRMRMLLALRLASSLLQLSQTRWLASGLSNESVYFLKQPTKDGVTQAVDYNRVFVSAPIGLESKQELTEPKFVLWELGILLLEIWHQTTLEAFFSLGEAPKDYFCRWEYAVKWRDEIDDPPLGSYEEAISYCLEGVLSKYRSGWNGNELWNSVYNNIIEPLSRNCNHWR
ncbi:hypothetical protein PT974_07968 [Cladobotryum mycophilum]|uniref:DUF7580 domain-containing protein n=1 Tax=Cladobotryum mycophilum TaxID=491253 RepID=A0ABR0SC39_9HYPO